MRAANVVIADLKSMEDCDKAIERIESDASNFEGGYAQWGNGRQAYMLAGAEKKVAAIGRKHDKLFAKMVKEQYAIYAKNEVRLNRVPVSFEVYDEDGMYC